MLHSRASRSPPAGTALLRFDELQRVRVHAAVDRGVDFFSADAIPDRADMLA